MTFSEQKTSFDSARKQEFLSPEDLHVIEKWTGAPISTEVLSDPKKLDSALVSALDVAFTPETPVDIFYQLLKIREKLYSNPSSGFSPRDWFHGRPTMPGHLSIPREQDVYARHPESSRMIEAYITTSADLVMTKDPVIDAELIELKRQVADEIAKGISQRKPDSARQRTKNKEEGKGIFHLATQLYYLIQFNLTHRKEATTPDGFIARPDAITQPEFIEYLRKSDVQDKILLLGFLTTKTLDEFIEKYPDGRQVT